MALGLRASTPHARTVHGMYVDAQLMVWRDHKRKWRSILGETNDYLVVEDRERLPVRPRGKRVAHTRSKPQHGRQTLNG